MGQLWFCQLRNKQHFPSSQQEQLITLQNYCPGVEINKNHFPIAFVSQEKPKTLENKTKKGSLRVKGVSPHTHTLRWELRYMSQFSIATCHVRNFKRKFIFILSNRNIKSLLGFYCYPQESAPHFSALIFKWSPILMMSFPVTPCGTCTTGYQHQTTEHSQRLPRQLKLVKN